MPDGIIAKITNLIEKNLKDITNLLLGDTTIKGIKTFQDIRLLDENNNTFIQGVKNNVQMNLSAGTSSESGAKLTLSGTGCSTNAGSFDLLAVNPSNNTITSSLSGKYDATTTPGIFILNWDGDNVVTEGYGTAPYAVNAINYTSSGSIATTFATKYDKAGGQLTGNIWKDGNSDFYLTNGFTTENNLLTLQKSPRIVIYTKNRSSGQGWINFTAIDETNKESTFSITPSGTISFDNNGTIETVITSNCKVSNLNRNVSDSNITISGGTSNTDGANLVLYGNSSSNNAGDFQLVARNASGSTAILSGNADGELTWNGVSIIGGGGSIGTADYAINYITGGAIDTTLNSKYAGTGGNLTGNIIFKNDTANNGNSIRQTNNNNYITVCGGQLDGSSFTGAYLHLQGTNYGNNASGTGSFVLQANDGNNSSYLKGKANGTLLWNNNEVLTSSNGKKKRYAYVGKPKNKSLSADTFVWFKFASTTITTESTDLRISFNVYGGVGAKKLGRLTALARSHTVGVLSDVFFSWDYANDDVDLSKYVLLYKAISDESIDIQLYYKANLYTYDYNFFSVEEEIRNRNYSEDYNLYTLYNEDSSDDYITELPDDYNQVVSELEVSQNALACCLPLTGGTVTGTVKITSQLATQSLVVGGTGGYTTSDDIGIMSANTYKRLRIIGGGNALNGGNLFLSGENYVNANYPPNSFSLSSTNGTVTYELLGSNDGTLTWKNSNIVTESSGTAIYATTASKIGSDTVGATNTPIYINAGKPTKISGNIGDANTPVYISGGTLTSTNKSFADYAALGSAQMTGGLKETTVSVSGTAPTINLNSGNCFMLTVTGNTNITTFSNPGTCTCFSLVLTNGGAYTITWPGSVKWEEGEAPELSSSGTDILTFITPNSGTTWYGNAFCLNAI